MDDPRALFVEAQDAHRRGDTSAARTLYSRVLAMAPEAHPAAAALCVLSLGAGDADAAVDYGRRAVEAAPETAPYHFHLAAALMAAGQVAEAADSYRRVLALAPDATPAAINLGIALHELGRFDEAVAAYRGAPAGADEDPLLNYNLGNALAALDRPDEAASAYRQAIAGAPDMAAAHFNLGQVLETRERFAQAVDAYRQAAALAPDHAEAKINLANALAESGNRDEAIAVLRGLAAARPDMTDAVYNLAAALLENGRAEEALEVCERFRARRGHHCGIIACRALALEALGRIDEAHYLNDFDRLPRPVAIEAPAGFDDLAQFNVALAAHILGHPTLRADPFGHATRHGQHTGELLAKPWGPMAAMARLIDAQARAYLDALPDDPDHPFLGYKPTRWRATAWAVVMGRQGHQIAHIHPAAWVSGVYYVEVPAIVSAADAGRAGWLEFGRPGEEFDLGITPRLRSIRPEPGLMVLFPAYMYHHTVPYDDAARRISLAFDIVAED